MTDKVRERRPGHFWADNEIIDEYLPKIGANGLAVYMVLARYANNESGKCFPSIKEIAKGLGISARSVQYTLRKLKTVGLISIEARTSKSGGQSSNLYTLLPIEKVDSKLLAPGAYSAPHAQYAPPGAPPAPPPKKPEHADADGDLPGAPGAPPAYSAPPGAPGAYEQDSLELDSDKQDSESGSGIEEKPKDTSKPKRSRKEKPQKPKSLIPGEERKKIIEALSRLYIPPGGVLNGYLGHVLKTFSHLEEIEPHLTAEQAGEFADHWLQEEGFKARNTWDKAKIQEAYAKWRDSLVSPIYFEMGEDGIERMRSRW